MNRSQYSEYTSLLHTPNEEIPRRENKFKSIHQSMVRYDLYNLIPSIILGIGLWWGIQPDDQLSLTSIRILAVFTSCIFALITTSVDISVLVLTALTLLSLTKSFQCVDQSTGLSVECRLCQTPNLSTGDLYECHGSKESFERSLEGFSSTVVWLIFAAFHLGKAVEVTELGKRISLILIKSFGSKVIGLGYAILISELVLAPFVPSNTARGGGIVLPVVQSIAVTLGSTPTSDPKIGGFLMLVGAHSNLLSASMYLTGMAPNPIVIDKANKLFPHLQFNFMTWITRSIVPSLFCAAILPLLIAYACNISKDKKDEEDEPIKLDGNDIIEHAQLQLNEMGAMSVKELQLCFVLLLCLTLWITSAYTRLDSTLVALMGIMTLLHLGTIEWKDVANNKNAWETFFWLGGFVTIAGQLSEAGASAFLGHKISQFIVHMNLPAVPALGIAYFLTTFMFSSLSAHTVAFVATFLDAGHALGADPMTLTCLLAFFGALGGCMTNFSTGSLAMYYAPGYVSRGKWFIVGGQLAIFYLVVYFTVGMGWWKLLDAIL